MGLIMWTLIGRVAIEYFSAVAFRLFLHAGFRQIHDPVIKVFDPVTPRFLVEPLVPLYVAWFLSLQVLFHALGTRVFGDGMLSFPTGE